VSLPERPRPAERHGDPVAEGTPPRAGSRPEVARRGARRRILKLSMFPTVLTLGNLVAGVLAISYVADASAHFAAGAPAAAAGVLTAAGWLVLLGMVFDALDGSVARLTRTTTEFGGALDSLADVVTFGVAPALIGKVLIERTLGAGQVKLAFLAAAFYAACATLRLARYNAEHDEPGQAVTTFKGLPSPGAAGVVAGIAIAHVPLLELWQPGPAGMSVAANVLRFVVLIGLGVLMVSRVPYVHVANRFLSGRKPVGRVALVLLIVVLLMHLPPEAVLAALFLGYALSGPLMVLPRIVRARRDSGVPELFD
jgi:CDP-diacylglycerol---serine O-phosphatidyltransferase